MKSNCKKGFTLAELLVVVAIIGVLVAIAIPTFTAQLNKAKQATNLANVRANYAEAVTTDMADGAAITVTDSELNKGLTNSGTAKGVGTTITVTTGGLTDTITVGANVKLDN